ncbi:pentapeptide repeat-containing protein [Candidatus Microthrix sp.]|uniref:pentapeptide repeat-containing protein n=1 Tax=Candidatus Neomicrothrix sp. TaxID=2719034 RepID=UPI0025922877|nr:pentapeptide repeat-containing protein [Candidatus Microthrix sp.]HMS47823.1 pentapeptide repeat-containing protein [Candidatus Microthrix sp.]
MVALTTAADGEEYVEFTYDATDAADVVLASVSFEDCVFEGLALESTRLVHCSFVDCVFRDCDLGVLLADDCVWRDVAFERCRIQGVDWRAPKGAGLGNQLRFDGCFLRYGVFMAAHLPRVEFANSDLRETEFSDADLTGASFAGCDLSGARFHNARLTEADFRGAQGYDLDVTTKLIKGATFSMPEAVRLLNGLDITVE